MRAILGVLAAACLCLPAHAQEVRTYQGVVVAVVDGDTIRVRVPAWEGTPFSPIGVRIGGIDTPEARRNLAKCDEELALGKEATAFARTLVKAGDAVTIVFKTMDKYGSRIVGDLILPFAPSFAAAMIDSGKAVPYRGGRRRSWCP